MAAAWGSVLKTMNEMQITMKETSGALTNRWNNWSEHAIHAVLSLLRVMLNSKIELFRFLLYFKHHSIAVWP